MILGPEDIKNRTFGHALRGYDKDEVRSFLSRVAQSSQELHDQLTATEEQLAAARTAETDTADQSVTDETALGDEVAEAADGYDGLATDTASQEETDAGPVDAVDHMDLAATERAIADRYGALGDRIADLLRSADESAAAIVAAAENDSEQMRTVAAAEAEQVRADAEARASELLAEAGAIRDEADTHRAEVMAELEAARTEQEAALAEAKASAEAEVETFRVDSINEIEALRSEARAEVEALRADTDTEIQTLRSNVEVEAESLRESAIAEGQSAIAEHEAEAARLRQEAEIDRQAARSELDDVRAEVTSLLEQARTQSEFIKQEADEIIRTKVRANFEQAQARIDVLRNTEVASRERIVRAQTELTSALNRLDSEPVPQLDPAAAPEIIEQAERRHDELAGGEPGAEHAGWDAGVIEASEVDDGDTEADAAWGGRAAFEADVAEANQQIEEEAEHGSPLSAFYGSGTDSDHDDPTEVTDDADDSEGVESFGAAQFDDSEAEHHEVDEPSDDVEDPSAATPGFADTLGEAIPAQGAELGGQAEEDALARLVREAMQEAVDSARKND